VPLGFYGLNSQSTLANSRLTFSDHTSPPAALSRHSSNDNVIHLG
jgi:hypothetical protein